MNASYFRSLPVLKHFDIWLISCPCFIVLSLCCCFKNRCVDKDHHQKVMGLTPPTFVPDLPKRVWHPLNRGVVSLCVSVCCLLPLWWCSVLSLCFAFYVFLYACVGCTMVFCLKVNWSACQLSKCNLCFAFWRLFWCSSQVLLCFNVSGWMYMLSFVFPCTLPCPTAFLVLRTCCTS